MNDTKWPKSKKLSTVVLSSIAAIVFIIWLAYAVIPKTIFSGLTNYYMPNYAKDLVKPIDQALIKSGAVRVCENATNGRDPGNMQPSYSAYYQFSTPNEDTIETLQSIAKENGYSLSSVASEYESIRHYSDTNKPSPYSDLESGKISLSFSAYSDTASNELACTNGKQLLGDKDHTAVSLSLVLPSFRHN